MNPARMVLAPTLLHDRLHFRSRAVRRIGRVGTFTLVSPFFFLVGGPAPLAAQGAVAGSVTDAESLAPVSGAQMFVEGTAIGTLTSARGTYRMEDVPAGSLTITVRLIGYNGVSQTVSVSDGQVATADFVIEQTALRLQDLVVTGLVGETPQVKLPFTVERLSADDLTVPASDVSSLLAAKAAGVSVMSGSGQPGQAASILLRGPTSINATGRTTSPLIVIDGVIQSESATLADIGALDIDHVEIVKGAAAASLFGSRAQNGVIQITSRRGTALQTNTFDIVVRGQYGFGQLAGDIGLVTRHPYLMNASQTQFIDSEGNETDFKDLQRPLAPVLLNQIDPPAPATPQTSFINQPFPMPLLDHMDTFFDPGETLDVYGAATGRLGESSFRASLDEFKETGVVSCAACIANLKTLNTDRASQGLEAFAVGLPADDGFERQNARLNVDTRFGAVDIAASGFYSRSAQDNKAVASGAFTGLTFMSPALDYAEIDPTDGFPRIDVEPLSLGANPLYTLAKITETNRRTRTMGSLDVTFSPNGLDWLTLEANASYDRTDFDDLGIRPKDTKTRSGGSGGSLRVGSFTDEAVNTSVTLGARESFLDSNLTLRGKARYLIENQAFQSNGAFASRFSVEGVPNFAAIVGETSGNNLVRQIRAEGLFAIASADYKGRYIVDGLVRRDGSSLFGPDERWQTYYRGSVAWRVAQEGFWKLDAIDELKLRFSLGTAGGRPNFFAQYETFGVQGGAIFPINLGNRTLRPEITTEREAGIQLVLFEKLGIDLTYAWQNTDDQLLEVPQPSFLGFSSQWQNAGEIAAETFEASLRYAAIDTRDVGLHFRLSWDRTRQEIVRLDVPDFTLGGFFVTEGLPLGEAWGAVWASSCEDLAPIGVSSSDCATRFNVNDDGLLVAVGEGNRFTDGFSNGLWGTTVSVADDAGSTTYDWGLPVKRRDYSPACVRQNPATFETECALTDFLPFGNGTPDWSASWATSFRFKGLSLNGLLEGSVGHSIYNGTAQGALRDLRGEDADQAGKPKELQKPIGYASALYAVGAPNSWFVEEGDWIKVRELSLGYTLPSSFVGGLLGGAVDRIRLNLIGRNLFTITDYRGYDPEVGIAGGPIDSPQLVRADFGGYPNFRTVSFSAEVVF